MDFIKFESKSTLEHRQRIGYRVHTHFTHSHSHRHKREGTGQQLESGAHLQHER